MDAKGQAFLVAIMVAIVFIILALAFAPAIKSFITDARSPSTDTSVGLDCSNSSISNFDKANCVVTDSFLPYFVGFLIFAGGAILGAKLLGAI